MEEKKIKGVVPGMVFGELTVEEDTGKRASDRSRIWRCSCSCGNQNYETVSSELKRAGSRGKRHCNNQIHFIDNIKGNIYGDLEVLEFYGTHKEGVNTCTTKAYWICKCNRCGNDNYIASAADLKAGKTKTCGCGKGFSRGAQTIKDLLLSNNIDVKFEYSFSDLLSAKNKKLYFDFAIFENDKLSYIIEYDGEQHFQYQEGCNSWNTKERFELTKAHDHLKNEYCRTHNIPLIRIPYTHKEKICIEDLILNTSSFIMDWF